MIILGSIIVFHRKVMSQKMVYGRRRTGHAHRNFMKSIASFLLWFGVLLRQHIEHIYPLYIYSLYNIFFTIYSFTGDSYVLLSVGRGQR
jgi:hypothetical protein